MKKAQITIFVIIGLVLVLVLGSFLFLVNKKPVNNVIDETQLSPVDSYVNDCLTQTVNEALLVLGRQGSIYPNVYMESQNNKIAYFYYKGDGFFPTKISSVSEEISRYVAENLDLCVGDFSDINFVGNTDPGKIRVTTLFNENDVTVDVYFPVTITIGDAVSTLTDFDASLEIRFEPIHELSREIYQKTKENPNWVDVDFLYKQPYNIRLVKISDDTMVYEITDDSGLNNEPFTYRFGVKFKL